MKVASVLFAYVLSLSYLAEGAIPILPSPLRPIRWMSRAKEDSQGKQTILDRLSIRGGAADQDPKSSKVKGLCVGIDLGTTYRYFNTNIYHVYSNTDLLRSNRHTQLCRCLEKRTSRSVP